MLTELSSIITEYETLIKRLQSENDILRFEMAKAGMKIPMVALSGVANTGSVSSQSGSTPIPITPPSSTSPSLSASAKSLTEISAKHGKDVAEFISRINQDWPAIRSHYAFSNSARLAGYELVQS
jgi:hypothetical protein